MLSPIVDHAFRGALSPHHRTPQVLRTPQLTTVLVHEIRMMSQATIRTWRQLRKYIQERVLGLEGPKAKPLALRTQSFWAIVTPDTLS